MLLPAHRSPLQKPLRGAGLLPIDPYLALYQQAEVLYSLRKTTPQATHAIRIRRDSDSVDKDIGFLGKDFNQQAIEDFGGKNLLSYTEDLTSPNWLSSISGTGLLPVVTSGVLAPDGTNTAFNVKLNLNGGTTSSDRSDILQYGSGNTIVGKSYTISVYLRSADGVAKDIVLINATGHSAIRNIGTSWSRYEFTKIETVANQIQFRLRLRGTQSDDSINLEVWHPQAEIGSSASEYQPRLQGGASDCTIIKWYDQINNNDSVQNNIALQPKIYDVESGEVTKENGKPAGILNGVGDNIPIVNVAGRSNIDAYFVNRHDDVSLTSINPAYMYPTGLLGSDFGYVATNGSTDSLHNNYGSPSLYKNNILLNVVDRDDVYNMLGQTQNIVNHRGANVSSWSNFNYGLYPFHGNAFNFEGSLQEIIVFADNLTTAERQILHDDMNHYYGIY